MSQTTLTVALLGLLAAGADGVPPFQIRLTAPEPLYLVGATRIEADAFDPSGARSDAVSYMSLSIDGDRPRPDGKPPFSWEVDLGADLRRRRLEVVAVARDGRKASLSVLSSAHPFVEAIAVDLVLVPVVVREEAARGGRIVSGLSAADFAVLEDGVEQPIASFSDEPIPASIVVALDNSLSMEGSLWSARKAVADFIDHQPPYVVLSLLTFNDQVFLEEDFTQHRERLRAALAACRAEGRRTALHEAVRIGSRHLASRAGARILVVFTDGEDTLDALPSGAPAAAAGRLRTAIETAQGSDVTIFAVSYGPRETPGLDAMASETGGEVVRARGADELTGAFVRIAESLGSRYVIGYEPPDPTRGGHRRIDVRVSREGVRALSRSGYRMTPGGSP